MLFVWSLQPQSNWRARLIRLLSRSWVSSFPKLAIIKYVSCLLLMLVIVNNDHAFCYQITTTDQLTGEVDMLFVYAFCLCFLLADYHHRPTDGRGWQGFRAVDDASVISNWATAFWPLEERSEHVYFSPIFFYKLSKCSLFSYVLIKDRKKYACLLYSYVYIKYRKIKMHVYKLLYKNLIEKKNGSWFFPIFLGFLHMPGFF